MITIRHLSCAIIATLLCSSLFMRSVRAEDTLSSEAESYLKTHSDPNADSRWEKDFRLAADDAMSQNQSITDEERYADDKALEFFFDKKKHFEESSADPLSVKDKIEVARWYLLFANNGWRFPTRIAAHLTKRNYQRYVAAR